MTITLKILNAVLILFALYMCIKQGSAMLSAKPGMLSLFDKWNIGKTGVMIIGAFTIIGAVMVLFPVTFVWGNFITAAIILLIIAFHIGDRNFKGVLTELPFLFLSLLIIYLQHPLAKNASGIQVTG